MPSSIALLHELVAAAGLPDVASYRAVTGHGFNNEILHATLVDSREVVLRRLQDASRPLPLGRALFLAHHDVPAPALLGGDESASLYEYVPGEMLSALVAEDRMTDDAWRSVGTAFRRVHAVRFPGGLAGGFGPDELILNLTDPVHDLHAVLDSAEPCLKANLPFVLPHLPRLHAVIDDHAGQLRATPTALAHGDVNPTNVIIGSTRTTLIDWDEPRVADPARELAELDERMHLINGSAVPAAFFETYGPCPPNLAIHRLTSPIRWFGHGPFAGWEIDPGLGATQKAQVTGWRNSLADCLAGLGERLREF